MYFKVKSVRALKSAKIRTVHAYVVDLSGSNVLSDAIN